jgi:hypothetical protein
MVNKRAAARVRFQDRIAKIRELQHFCQLYDSAYIQHLEGRGESNGNRMPSVQCERVWNQILDMEHQTLIQEGRVPLVIDESVYEEE